jgi:hypothetical protein
MYRKFLLLVAALATVSSLCCGAAHAAASDCKTYYPGDAASAPPEVARLLQIVSPWRSRIIPASSGSTDVSIKMCKFTQRIHFIDYQLQMPVQRTGDVCHFLWGSVADAFGKDVRHLDAGKISYDKFLRYAHERMLVTTARCPLEDRGGGYVSTADISPDLFRQLSGAWSRLMSSKTAFAAMVHLDVSDRGPTGQFDPVKEFEEFEKTALPRYLTRTPSPNLIDGDPPNTKDGEYVMTTTDPEFESAPSGAGWDFTFKKEGVDWKVIRINFWTA